MEQGETETDSIELEVEGKKRKEDAELDLFDDEEEQLAAEIHFHLVVFHLILGGIIFMFLPDVVNVLLSMVPGNSRDISAFVRSPRMTS